MSTVPPHRPPSRLRPHTPGGRRYAPDAPDHPVHKVPEGGGDLLGHPHHVIADNALVIYPDESVVIRVSAPEREAGRGVVITVRRLANLKVPGS